MFVYARVLLRDNRLSSATNAHLGRIDRCIMYFSASSHSFIYFPDTNTQMLSGAFMCAHTHTHKGGHLHSMRNHMDRFFIILECGVLS